MEDGRIKDMQITITGRARGTSAVGWQARLNKNIPAYGAWCVYVDEGLPYKKNYDQHIQINLLKLTIIAKIATQGREYANGTEHVEDYKISYSNDSHNWMFYKDQTSHETQVDIMTHPLNIFMLGSGLEFLYVVFWVIGSQITLTIRCLFK